MSIIHMYTTVFVLQMCSDLDDICHVIPKRTEVATKGTSNRDMTFGVSVNPLPDNRILD